MTSCEHIHCVIGWHLRTYLTCLLLQLLLLPLLLLLTMLLCAPGPACA